MICCKKLSIQLWRLARKPKICRVVGILETPGGARVKRNQEYHGFSSSLKSHPLKNSSCWKGKGQLFFFFLKADQTRSTKIMEGKLLYPKSSDLNVNPSKCLHKTPRIFSQISSFLMTCSSLILENLAITYYNNMMDR